MTLTLSIILLSLLSTVINRQLQNCPIEQNTGCRISSTDLTTHALVQTLSPIQCIAPAMDSFTLKSFRIEFNIITKRVGDGITSIKMSECQRGNQIAATSTLSYYDKSMDTHSNTLGIIGSASSSSSDTYALKLDPLSTEPQAGWCDMTWGGGVCDCNPNCPLICIDECIDDPNVYISDIGDQWIQFIDKYAMGCAGNEMSPTSVTVYLVNLNAPAVGFQMTFKMRLMSINVFVDEISELEDGGANEVQPPSYSSTVYISDGDFNTQTVIDNGYYEMKFEFYTTEPIRGTDCSNAMDCKYFWELILEENDEQSNGIGVYIIGCDGITYDKTIQYFNEVYESKDNYDLSYRLDGYCDGGHTGGQFDYCMGSEWNYISVIIEPTPPTQITAFTWQSQQQNMEAQCGNAFFDTIENYQPTSNYCYDYWMPTADLWLTVNLWH